MDPNPYAAPSMAVDLPRAPLEPDDAAGEWTIVWAFRRAWLILRRHWVLLLIPACADMVPAILQEPALDWIPSRGAADLATRAAVVFGVSLIGAITDAGATAQWLAAARGERPGWSTFRSGLRRVVAFAVLDFLQKISLNGVETFARILGHKLPSWVGLVEGTAGAIVGMWLGLAYCALLEEQSSVLRALNRAWQLSAGTRGRMVACGLVQMVLAFLGLLACVVGIFPVAAILQGLPVVIYLRLRRQEDAPAVEG